MAEAIHAVSPCPESILGRQVTPPGRPRRWTGVHRWRLLDLGCWCSWVAGPCLAHRTPPPSQTSRRNPLKPVAEPLANQSQNPEYPYATRVSLSYRQTEKNPSSHGLLSALEGYRQDSWRITDRVLAILLRGCQPKMSPWKHSISYSPSNNSPTTSECRLPPCTNGGGVERAHRVSGWAGMCDTAGATSRTGLTASSRISSSEQLSV